MVKDLDGTASLTPNVRRLVGIRMAQLMVPEGTGDPLMAGVKAILGGGISAAAKESMVFVHGCILLVRNASEAEEPNPWKNADDETIAAEILKKIEQRRNSASNYVGRPE